MPQFKLNTYGNGYDSLSPFARRYVEAMFFTNGDIGSDRENHLNELGTGRLTRRSIAAIKVDCDKFLAMEVDGKTVQQWLDESELDPACVRSHCAAHDLWFSRQGHGCGFWDGDWPAPYDDALDKAAKQMGECVIDVSHGWIHIWAES